MSQLVEEWAKKSRRLPEHMKDLAQQVAERLLASKPPKNFGGFVTRAMRNALVDERRRERAEIRALDQFRGSRTENSCYFPFYGLRLDLEDAIRKNFSEDEARVICDYFGAGFTLDEISKKYGLKKRSGWHSWLRGAAVVLREALKDYRNGKGEICF